MTPRKGRFLTDLRVCFSRFSGHRLEFTILERFGLPESHFFILNLLLFDHFYTH